MATRNSVYTGGTKVVTENESLQIGPLTYTSKQPPLGPRPKGSRKAKRAVASPARPTTKYLPGQRHLFGDGKD